MKRLLLIIAIISFSCTEDLKPKSEDNLSSSDLIEISKLDSTDYNTAVIYQDDKVVIVNKGGQVHKITNYMPPVAIVLITILFLLAILNYSLLLLYLKKKALLH